MSDQIESNGLNSGVLRTTRAFKNQIKASENRGESKTPIIHSWKILEALSLVRKSLREVCSELGPDSVELNLVEDDEFGWPRMSLRSNHGENSLVNLTVGAHDRRNGTILFFKLQPSDLNVELLESDYSEAESVHRALRLFIRRFYDQISKVLEDQGRLEKQFSGILESIDMPPELGLGQAAGDLKSGDSDNLFPKPIPDPASGEGDNLLLDDDDFFS